MLVRTPTTNCRSVEEKIPRAVQGCWPPLHSTPTLSGDLQLSNWGALKYKNFNQNEKNISASIIRASSLGQNVYLIINKKIIENYHNIP